jgi:hypothetical protein
VYVAAGNFTMSGRSIISGNTATTSITTTTFGDGGGVYKTGTGLFTMSGYSSIKNNTARYGGGVYIVMGGVSATTYFTMASRCEISGNKAVATADTGGGVYMTGAGTFTNIYGVIKENKVEATGSGGGVYMAAGAICVNTGNISSNTALGDNSGGGVYVTGAGTKFEMTSTGIEGKITDNEAKGANAGGGAYVTASGSFTLSGIGSITLNFAWGSGTVGGVKKSGTAGTVTVSSNNKDNYAEGVVSNGP